MESQILHEHDLVRVEDRYLSLIDQFLKFDIDRKWFQHHLSARWAEEREAMWQAANRTSSRDFRPLLRMLDRVSSYEHRWNDSGELRDLAQSLLSEYRHEKLGMVGSILANPADVPIYERPLPLGWVYPCTADDIRRTLAFVPEQDITGLTAIALISTKRQDWRYGANSWFGSWRQRRPGINLHAWSLSRTLKLRCDIREAKGRRAIEISYGMQVERASGGVECRWEPECLRRYVAEHVLLHEIGHHVQRRHRLLLGLQPFRADDRAAEQFADYYARRMVRQSREALELSYWVRTSKLESACLTESRLE